MQVEDKRKLRSILIDVTELQPGTPFEVCGGWAASLRQEYRIMILLDISESSDSIDGVPAIKAHGMVAAMNMMGQLKWLPGDERVRPLDAKLVVGGVIDVVE